LQCLHAAMKIAKRDNPTTKQSGVNLMTACVAKGEVPATQTVTVRGEMEKRLRIPRPLVRNAPARSEDDTRHSAEAAKLYLPILDKRLHRFHNRVGGQSLGVELFLG
jgi:hypothetical protein